LKLNHDFYKLDLREGELMAPVASMLGTVEHPGGILGVIIVFIALVASFALKNFPIYEKSSYLCSLA